MTPDPINLKIGRKVFVARALRGITLEQLAKSIEVSKEKMLAYEQGLSDLTMEQLNTIADYIGVPMRYFFEDVD